MAHIPLPVYSSVEDRSVSLLSLCLQPPVFCNVLCVCVSLTGGLLLWSTVQRGWQAPHM